MSAVRPLATPVRADPVREAKVHLAAAHRMAVLHELEEGIDNHFTVTVPGRNDQFLVLPFGRHWSEARASDLFVFDESGRTIEGEGTVELSARCIHAPIHRITGARVVMHTHQTWALALNMLKDNRVVPASQTAAFYCDMIAYDDDYQGTADSLAEGERLARLIGNKKIVFLRNHGILVATDTIAQAYKYLYKMERVCRTQVLALSTGRELNILSRKVVDAVLAPAPEESHSTEERDRLFFEAMMRIVDRELPGYRD
ncbi:MAG: class II aldolase/adducin family protein [Burkholderiales bacterium]|nr:class II aldolase/adducin family protein [Burkholderiales bacterium]